MANHSIQWLHNYANKNLSTTHALLIVSKFSELKIGNFCTHFHKIAIFGNF